MENSKVKGVMGKTRDVAVWFWKDIRSYADVKGDLESQLDIEQSIRSGVSFKGSQLLTLIFAIFIASLGLNTNSIPVIIGAMLISPLMGPIMGMGLGIGVQDFTLLKRSLKNIVAAVLGSLVTSAIYFLISPQYEGASQLLARTSPSIYDVFVAVFGGAAGILSVAAKNKGQVMPGVAIATSLMPPLCTAGYGLATWQMNFFLGALYLFFTNMIFIMVTTWVGVKLMGFRNVVFQDERRARRVQRVVTGLVVATVCVSVYLTVVMIRKNVFIEKASAFVENQFVFPNTQVLSHKEYVEGNTRHIDVTLIGEALPKDSLQLAMVNKMDSVGLGGTLLTIKQGFSVENGKELDSDDSGQFYALMQNEIAQRQEEIDSLKSIVSIKVLFPSVKDIALARMVASAVGSDQNTDTIDMMFVNAPAGMTAADRRKLTEYVEVRLNRKNIHLTLNPSGFPWPSRK